MFVWELARGNSLMTIVIQRVRLPILADIEMAFFKRYSMEGSHDSISRPIIIVSEVECSHMFSFGDVTLTGSTIDFEDVSTKAKWANSPPPAVETIIKKACAHSSILRFFIVSKCCFSSFTNIQLRWC